MSYAGKLNGAMLAQTPSGTFLTNVSMSLLTRGHEVVGITRVIQRTNDTFKFVTLERRGYSDGRLDDLEPAKEIPVGICFPVRKKKAEAA